MQDMTKLTFQFKLGKDTACYSSKSQRFQENLHESMFHLELRLEPMLPQLIPSTELFFDSETMMDSPPCYWPARCVMHVTLELWGQRAWQGLYTV